MKTWLFTRNDGSHHDEELESFGNDLGEAVEALVYEWDTNEQAMLFLLEVTKIETDDITYEGKDAQGMLEGHIQALRDTDTPT